MWFVSHMSCKFELSGLPSLNSVYLLFGVYMLMKALIKSVFIAIDCISSKKKCGLNQLIHMDIKNILCYIVFPKDERKSTM